MVAAPEPKDTAYVRSWALIGFDALVASKGFDPVALLNEAGIDPRVLDTSDMLLSFARKGRLLEIAAERLGAPSFGLEWALSVPEHFPDTGPVLLLTGTASTFSEWLKRAAQYWLLQSNAVTPDVVQHEALGAFGVRLSRAGGQPIERQHMEHLTGKIVRLIRAVLDDTVNPVKVTFKHARPDDISLHESIFRCPLEFGASHDEIVFPLSILRRPMADRAGETEAIANEFLRRRIGQLSRYRPSVSTSTALAIKTVLGTGICSKEFIARTLECSPRKLQRLLAAEGTTYEDILDSVRREVGCALLADSAAPVAAIGNMLDFTSPAAMTLAVRRWTGMTPSDYRAHVQSRAEAAPDAQSKA